MRGWHAAGPGVRAVSHLHVYAFVVGENRSHFAGTGCRASDLRFDEKNVEERTECDDGCQHHAAATTHVASTEATSVR